MLALPVEMLEQIVANLTDKALFDSCKEKNLWFLIVRYEAYKKWTYYMAEIGKVHWEIQELERQNREGQLTWFAYSKRHNAFWDKKMFWTSDQINIMKQMLKKGMISIHKNVQRSSYSTGCLLSIEVWQSFLGKFTCLGFL
jgi:hypothetical protein